MFPLKSSGTPEIDLSMRAVKQDRGRLLRTAVNPSMGATLGYPCLRVASKPAPALLDLVVASRKSYVQNLSDFSQALTGYNSPVSPSEAGDARNTAKSATFSGVGHNVKLGSGLPSLSSVAGMML